MTMSIMLNLNSEENDTMCLLFASDINSALNFLESFIIIINEYFLSIDGQKFYNEKCICLL